MDVVAEEKVFSAPYSKKVFEPEIPIKVLDKAALTPSTTPALTREASPGSSDPDVSALSNDLADLKANSLLRSRLAPPAT